MRAGPTALMPETLRLRRDPLRVSAARPTLVTLVHRLSDATCVGASSALSCHLGTLKHAQTHLQVRHSLAGKR